MKYPTDLTDFDVILCIDVPFFTRFQDHTPRPVLRRSMVNLMAITKCDYSDDMPKPLLYHQKFYFNIHSDSPSIKTSLARLNYNFELML